MMVREYAVRLQPEQREELQHLSGEKLRPSDRPSADSAQERRWLGAPQVAEALDLCAGVLCIGSSSALMGRPWRGPCGTGPRPTGIGSWMTRGAPGALACSPAPEGHDHWTLRLAGKVVELGLASSMSHEGVPAQKNALNAEEGVVHSQGERGICG